MSWRFRFKRQLVFLSRLFWEGYRERIALSIIATVVFGLLISILNRAYYGTGFWDHFEFEADIDKFFCEYTNMKRFVRQPVNTFTNFIYLIIAMYCFSKGLEDIKKKRAYNLITANRFYSFTLAAIALYTFIGSTLFHSSLIGFFSAMDFSAVYSISLFPLMYFTHRVWLTVMNKPSHERRSKERLFLIAIFIMIYTFLTLHLDIRIVHPAVTIIILTTMGLGIYLERKDPDQTNKDYLIATIVSILIAGALFELDIKHVFCTGMGRITPHSLWHIFNGMSVFFLYLYIRSERYDHMQDDLRIRLRNRGIKSQIPA